MTAAAALGLMVAGSAGASTYAFTEGNGQNRALVAGSVDLEDASSGGDGFDLGAYGANDVVGIYGRIVGAVDRFTFSVSTMFDLQFDLDGYALDSGGSVAGGLSGLVNQTFATSGGSAGGDLSKGVTISLIDALTDGLVGSEAFATNLTSANLLDPVIFGDVGPGTYTLIVDGRNGPNKGAPALYDLEVVAAVPLPAAGWLLICGLGGLALMRRRAA
ncbi:MAG: VPLPA-CTERM sorting domain-containing protein [Pseudomonadota bacterium]